MELRSAFAATLRSLRALRALTQEDFSEISSRTNVSLLERGRTIPTLEKLEQLCSVLEVHPITFVTACYSCKEGLSRAELLRRVNEELGSVPEFVVDPMNEGGLAHALDT